MKIWLVNAALALLALPAAAAEVEAEQREAPANWLDNSHAYATEQAQALSLWMDSFFGDPNYDIEQPESLLRLEWGNKWSQQDGGKTRLRLRGKVQLPNLSERLNLVFSGEDGDLQDTGQPQSRDRVGLLYKVGERRRSRVDLTMGLDWGELEPGIRYRNQGPIGESSGYRFTQRLEWEADDGWQTSLEFNLDNSPNGARLLRWGNRIRYGEETDGFEWRSHVSLRQRFQSPLDQEPYVLSYFTSIDGVTDPDYVRNYSVGLQWRRQLWRRYLFLELEPSYNFPRQEDGSREGSARIELRLEIVFARDLRRNPDKTRPDPPPRREAPAS